jgi:hypothetical protein
MPLNHEGFYLATDFTWPVTYSYQVLTPGGLTSQEITVDVPMFENNSGAAILMARKLWIAALAPAMSVACSMIAADVRCWRGAPYWLDGGATPTFGAQFGLPASREHTPVVVMHTDRDDRYSRRRLFLAGAPRGWITDSLVNEEGAGELRTILHGLYGGLVGSIENAPMSWLIRYPEAVPDPTTGTRVTGFRVVSHLRLCHYTVPFPDYSFTL